MVRRRPAPFGALVFSLALSQAPATGPEARAQTRQPNAPLSSPARKSALLEIRVADGRVTADIADCPLHEALAGLAERTGIIFEVRSEPNPYISVHLRDVPMEEAIGRIVPDGNILFLYDGADPARIVLVRILSSGGTAVQPGLLYFGTGRVPGAGRPAGTAVP
ncbi:MAG: hypothetical protein GXY47_07200 [Acidobacteria bacterium]|mgnify:CR=1 FL=1|nr:hypothetical protein [Acidobacteriota bacterium]